MAIVEERRSSRRSREQDRISSIFLARHCGPPGPGAPGQRLNRAVDCNACCCTPLPYESAAGGWTIRAKVSLRTRPSCGGARARLRPSRWEICGPLGLLIANLGFALEEISASARRAGLEPRQERRPDDSLAREGCSVRASVRSEDALREAPKGSRPSKTAAREIVESTSGGAG